MLKVLIATLVAAGSAAVAWKAAMKQVAVIQSERDRRSKYAAGIGTSYLDGAKQILAKIERE